MMSLLVLFFVVSKKYFIFVCSLRYNEKMRTIKRQTYIDKVKPFIDSNLIKVFTGSRRAGKSVLMQLVQNELIDSGVNTSQILALNFESRIDGKPMTGEIVWNKVKEKVSETDKKVYLFFDEVQELNEWEKIVNSIQVDFDVDIYLTGSNAKLLSSELSTYLSGRYIEIKVYPFSFKEVVQIKEESNIAIDNKKLFREYIIKGGYPVLYNYQMSYDDEMLYLSDLFNSIILKDVAQRNNIRDVALFKQIVIFIMANVGNLFSATSVIKYLKNEKRNLSTETLYNYLDFCKSVYLVNMIQRQNIIGKELLSSQNKIYMIDHGLRQAIYGNNQRDINQILENIVCVELQRRGYNVTIGCIGAKEVDFCATKNEEVIYFQVTYLLASEETIEREFGSLMAIQDNYPKYVLSLDELDFSRDGIIHKNIVEWLLE